MADIVIDELYALVMSSIKALVPGAGGLTERLLAVSDLHHGAIERLIESECDVYFQWAGHGATLTGFNDHLRKQITANPQKYAVALAADMKLSTNH